VELRKLQVEATQLAKAIEDRRKNDPLYTFKPHPKQQEFHNAVYSGEKSEVWCFGANRCITPATLVEMDHATAPISTVVGDSGFYVQSSDGNNRCTKKASPVFLKGIEPAFRIHLDNGQFFECSYKHRVLTPSGWASVGSLLSSQDDLRCSGKYEDYLGNYGKDSGLCDPLPHFSLSNDIKELLREAGVPQYIQPASLQQDVMVPKPERIHAYLASCHHSNLDDQDLLLGLFDLWIPCSAYTIDQSLIPQHLISRTTAFESNLALKEELSPEILDQLAVLLAYYSLPYPIPLSDECHIVGYQKIGLRPIVDFSVEDTECYYAAGVIHHNSGKSDIGSYTGSHLARFGPPEKLLREQYADGGKIMVKDRATSGWVVSLDFPTGRDIVQPKYFDNGVGFSSHDAFIPKREIKEWRQSDQILKLHNGSIIGFKSADSGRLKFQGAEKDWIHYDEEPPQEVYKECSMRVGTRKLIQFGTCTLLPPEGQVGGVTWLYQDMAKPYMNGTLPENCHVLTMAMIDNPYLPPELVEEYASKYKPDSVEYRIRVLGELLPGLSGARCYTGFSYETHVKSQVGYYNPHLPLAWAMDFNVSPYITLVGQRDMSKFRVFRELFLEEGDHDRMCELFYTEFGGHRGPVFVYGDATGQRRNMTGKSDYTIIVNNMRRHNMNIHLKLPSVNPNVPDRINAVNRAFINENKEVNLEIDPSCEELIADFEQVLRDPRGGIKKVTNTKDPYYRRTHSCLTGDTLISVGGLRYKYIKDIKTGDEVWTPCGMAIVENAGEVAKVDKLVRLKFDNFEEITCTPEHKFFTDRGLVEADALRYSDVLIKQGHSLWKSALNTTGGNIGFRDAITNLVETKKESSVTCIDRFGVMLTEKYQKTITSIIKTVTALTTPLRILSVSLLQNTFRIMESQAHGVVALKTLSNSNQRKSWQNYGTQVMKAESGTATTQEKFIKKESGLLNLVSNAVKNIKRLIQRDQDSVIRIVSKSLVNCDSVSVYDLTVAKHHCYLANGVLVSNSDGVGYWISYEAPVTTNKAQGISPTYKGAVVRAPGYAFSKRNRPNV
jgi:phage terminase large subunit-like protein